MAKNSWGGARPNQTGRPPTVRAGLNLNIRIDKKTMAILERLAARWDCGKSEAVRRAIVKADKRGD